ncbi:hypothetical protein BBJ29_008769 [Phytophthora kernoviae]|uniref:Cas12f1-like TNB domain-containing protein n=1 Tax=Phytophthora kernoviae TaxID=325452 RepID=A0A421FX00_9STRA|nr:hypothetical protein BBJ29_008769 [Phytophthora kernoviae]
MSSSSERVCAIDPGVRNFATVYDPDGRIFSATDSKSIMMNKFKVIDQMKSLLKRMDNASKAKHQDRKKTKNKRGRTSSKTEEGRLRYRLRRRIWFTSRKATRAMTDLHQNLSSWLSANYYNVLLPSFQTAEMVRKHFEEVASDATPETASDEMRVAVLKRKIRSPTARAMMAQAHYRFKMLLKYKMVRSGGGVIDCEEEHTSKTCSRCGAINHKLGGKHVFQCPSCNVVLDRDVNAAKNIFHKNMCMLG